LAVEVVDGHLHVVISVYIQDATVEADFRLLAWQIVKMAANTQSAVFFISFFCFIFDIDIIVSKFGCKGISLIYG
jgi:hypothetical protein